MSRRLWVVVPAYDEAGAIGTTLTALAAQTDPDFALVVVDNNSTDGTADVVRRFAAGAPFPVDVVTEPRPGAGTAADTGCRHAIAAGATLLLRTDADCRPAPDWVATAKALLDSGAEMVCGRSVPRRDERPSFAERRLFPAAVRAAGVYGRFRRTHRAAGFRTPYVLCHGHNLALTADLYVRCGGIPRITLRDGADDLDLLNRARRHTDRIVRAEHLVVENSLRRLRAWGPRRTLLWYWDRRWQPTEPEGDHVR
ncbi:glycosyltransferase family 2 protein [Polymorphospora sp. NPDC050346]|uniref:glycosyltransferase family 2 protein n=1 Tax=Polymorphospora sp. NPDC050346 TaxID=3155780 RepID=UPI0033F1C7E3